VPLAATTVVGGPTTGFTVTVSAWVLVAGKTAQTANTVTQPILDMKDIIGSFSKLAKRLNDHKSSYYSPFWLYKPIALILHRAISTGAAHDQPMPRPHRSTLGRLNAALPAATILTVTAQAANEGTMENAEKPGPLTGVRVLDLGHYIAIPILTRMMADLGAEIIKVEAAPHGDLSRFTPIIKNGFSGGFIQHNRGALRVFEGDADAFLAAILLEKPAAEGCLVGRREA